MPSYKQGGSSHRKRHAGNHKAKAGHRRPPSESSQRTAFSSVKRPAAAWHSDTSTRPRLTTSSRSSSIRPEANPLFLTPAATRPRHLPSVDDPDESADHVIMALDIKERGTVGCAYYVAREQRLMCMEDVPKGGLEVIDHRECLATLCTPRRRLMWQVKIDIQPTVVIISTRLDVLFNSNEGRYSCRQPSGNEHGKLTCQVRSG